jgi:hypothetical protein
VRARALSKQLEEAGDLAAPEAVRRLRELSATEQRTLLLLTALRSFYVALSSRGRFLPRGSDALADALGFPLSCYSRYCCYFRQAE